MRTNSGKHTTNPRGWSLHGNRNEHKKRAVPSSLRTFGRASRFAKRHEDTMPAAWLKVANARFLKQLREEANNNPEGFEPG